MTEVGLRKFHRYWGICLVTFLAIQAVTGLILAIGDLALGAPHGEFLLAIAAIHQDWNPIGSIYRIILALATAVQGISGIVLFLVILSRTRQTQVE
jgi:hypothetical protein